VDKMVADTTELLENENIWTPQRDHSRRLTRERYRWDRVFSSLESGIRSCLCKEARNVF